MTREDDLSEAELQGHAAGRNEAIRELRAFTGIDGLTPPLNLPEHVAYFVYERELLTRIESLAIDFEVRKERAIKLADHRDSASRRRDEEMTKRQDDRAQRGPLIRAIGNLGDFVLATKVDHAKGNLQANWARAKQNNIESRISSLQLELVLVEQWILQLFIDVDEARKTRSNGI